MSKDDAFQPGDVGENFVQTWASQAGITANASRRDEFGWDFCFQIRDQLVPVGTVPLDLSPPELTCMVQVKTTTVGARREPVKLSNWQRMVKDPLPWFLVIISLDAAAEPKSVHLVHVSEIWIERVLRRLRTATTSKRALHHRTLGLTWRANESIAKPFAASLRERLVNTVGDFDAYVKKKLNVRETIGYGKARYHVELRPALGQSDADIERAVDFAIGLVSQLPISALTVRDLRFDIPHVVKDLHDTEGYVEFGSRPSAGKSSIIVSDKKREESVVIECDTYVPTFIFPHLPMKHWKVRFVSPFATFVCNQKTLALQLVWQLPERSQVVSLSDLSSVARLAMVFGRGARSGIFISYESKGKIIDIAHGDALPEVPSEVLELAAIVQDARFLAKHFDLPSEALVNIDMLYVQGTRIRSMRAMVDPSMAWDAKPSVTTRTNAEIEVSGKTTAVGAFINVRIGDHILAGVLAVIGPCTWESVDDGEAGGKISVSEGTLRVLKTWAIPVSQWATFAPAKRSRELGEALATEAGIDFVVWPDQTDDEDSGEKDPSA